MHESIAGYSVLEQLGQGGFARVYRARHEQTHRVVALKVLHYLSALDDEARERHRARFWRETALCADLHHPNIVGLVDRGQTAGGELFAAYEFVPGQTLKSLLTQQGALAATQATELMTQVLDAIACAHASGIVHRDLKPENIMVTQTGARRHAIVLDFGVGAFTEGARAGQEQLTLTSESVGTPAYAAPEQLRGERSTPKSDIYAWALVFVECLTGVPAIQGDAAAEVVRRQLDGAEVPLPPNLSGHELGALLRRALRKNPAQRAASAARLMSELSAINVARLVGLIEAGVGGSIPLARTEEAVNPNWYSLTRHERRQLTLLVCEVELVDVAESGQDQERLEQLQHDLLNRAHDLVDRWGGWVAGTLAGRVLAYFGYPYVLHDDTRRAARAALEFLIAAEQATRGTNGPWDRIGVSAALDSGKVIVTHAGPQDGMTQSATSRLLRFRANGRLLAGTSAARLLSRWPELVLSPAEGVPGAQLVTLVERDTSVAERRLVGRSNELGRLEHHLARAGAGEGSIVFVRGEAGIGKSSLLSEFKRCVPPDTVLQETRCSSEQRNAALFPLLERLMVIAQRRSDAANDIRRSLEALFGATNRDPVTMVPLLCNWVGASIPTGYAPLRESPERQKAILFDFLLEHFLPKNPGQPVVLLMEDVQWADPMTLEFLAAASKRVRQSGTLLVVTARSEFDAPWLSEEVERLELVGLSALDAAALAHNLLGAPLDSRALESIVDRTEGVPFFLEEVLSTLRDRALLILDSGSYLLDARAEAAGVPATLRDALTERLDRLGLARESIALAAALGREFDVAVLEALSDRTPQEVAADILVASNRNMIAPVAAPESRTYVFRHALIQECANELLLPSARQRVNSRIADVLMQRFPSSSAARPALLAEHLATAERFSEAVTWGTTAARLALGRAANQEAETRARTVLEWTERLPAPLAVDAKLEANAVLIQALMATRGWADVLVKERVDFSTGLLKQSSNPELLVDARWALLTYHYVASNRAELALLADQFHDAASARGDAGLLAASNTFLGLVLHGKGEYARAAEKFKRVRGLYDPTLHRAHGARFGLDTFVWATATLALVEWFRGNEGLARGYSEQAVSSARELQHLPSLGIALLYAANLHHYAGERDVVAQLSRELIALDAQYGFPAYAAYGAFFNAWCEGDVRLPEALMTQLQMMGCTAALSYYGSLAAETDAAQGRARAALDRIDACIELCSKNQERYFEAELRRQQGSYLLALSDSPGAAAAFHRSIALAREQGAQWVEWRAAAAIEQIVIQ